MEQPMTRKAYEKLQEELRRLQEVELPAAQERMARARELGDLRENAEYHASKEELQRLHERIATLVERLRNCRIVADDEIPRDKVALGARVRIYDITYEEERVIEFVSPGEENVLESKLLITSPIGQALLGKGVGEEVEMQTPRGPRRVRILEISYPTLED